MPTALSEFEGKAVRRSGLEIPNAAGGLREAMKIDPQEIHQGERLFVVLEVVCQKIRHEPIDKDDPAGDQERVHVLVAEGATFVDRELVEEQLSKQKARIALAKDEDSGQQRMEHSGELELEHFAGQHQELVEGCPSCDKEKRLEAEEAEAPTPIGEAKARKPRKPRAKKAAE